MSTNSTCELRRELFDGRLTLIVGPPDKFNRYPVKATNCERVLHRDHFNLDNAHLREKFVVQLDSFFTSIERQAISQELVQLVDDAQTHQWTSSAEPEAAVDEPPPAPPEPGSERYNRAMSLLLQPDLFAAAERGITALGHVGNDTPKQQVFLCAVSAFQGDCLQPAIHAPSSTGKNDLCDKTLVLVPPERVIRRSALSAKALFRTEQSLKHRIIYIQEVAGSQSADYHSHPAK